MKVLVVNNIDIKGGAYRASKNIHKALIQAGIDSIFYSYCHLGSDFYRKTCHSADRLPLRFYPNRQFPDFFSPARAGINIRNESAFNEADVINLHWTTGGFLSLKSIEWIMKLGKPVVWTMHDFWPVSGGCHLNRGCLKFEQQCGACPVLGSVKEYDLSRKIWEKKKAIYQNTNIHWVTVSNWFMSQAKKSSLVNHSDLSKIFNAIDTETFAPADKLSLRKELKLPDGQFILLCGGFGITKDPNKGFADLLTSLQILKDKHNTGADKILLVVFGDVSNSELAGSEYPVINAGLINDDSLLAKYYAAADVFVCTSKQETGPTTIPESMSCGTPVISYQVGIVPEIIKNDENGFICPNNNSEEIANGILYFYSMEKEKRSVFGTNARKMIASNCSYEITGKMYLQLFSKIREEHQSIKA